MSDIDPRTGAPIPSPGTPRPGEGAPAAGQQPPAEHLGEEATQASNGEAHADGNGATELQGDLDELVRVAAQRDEYLALAQRTQADFENYRKRVARDAAAAKERGVSALAKELLPALDNLDRAMGTVQEDDPLLEGVRLVRAELTAALLRAGIESFSPLGEAFDPSLHEAVATAPGPDGTGSGMVIEVYQDGYRLGESVLRPARVVVGS